MNRRELLWGAGALLTSALAGNALASSHKKHEHHEHGKKYHSLIESGLNCVEKGQICIQHCLDYFGDASLAECAASVQQMLPVCSTLSQLATFESPHLKAYIQACIAICQDCEKACRVHADTHKPCMDCAEACKQCIEACNKVLNA